MQTKHKKFELQRDQADFLLKKYPNIKIVRHVFSQQHGLLFDLSVDDYIDFYEWLEDESIRTMKNDEPTDDTYMLESIFDSMYVQTN